MTWLNTTKFRQIEESALEIREKFEILLGHKVIPPIPVCTITENLCGLTIVIPERWKYSKNTVAILNPESKRIILRYLPDPRVQRFGIAHELGHWILHRRILERPRLSPRIKIALEREANLFAETILMPASDLEQMCFKLGIEEIDGRAFQLLARNCFVTSFSLKIRFQNLLKYDKWNGPGLNWSDVDNTQAVNNLDSLLSKRHRTAKLINQLLSQHLGFAVGNNDKLTKPATIKPMEDRAVRNNRSKPVASVPLAKPFVIEFSGMPNSGKDTLIGDMQFWLSHQHGLTVKVIDEAIKDQPYPREQIINRFRQSYHVTIINLLEAIAKPDVYDVILLNRGLFDLLAWIKYYQKRGFIGNNEADILTKVISLEGYKEIEDIVIFFEIDPDTSFQREKIDDVSRASRLKKIGTKIDDSSKRRFVITPESLRVLHEAYREAYGSHLYDFHVKKVNANQNGFGDVFEKTLDICEPFIIHQSIQLELPF